MKSQIKSFLNFSLILFSVVGSILLVFTILENNFYYGEPDEKEARKMLGDFIPNSAKLVYSKKYRASSNSFYRLSCFVFEYSEEDFIAYKNYDFQGRPRHKISSDYEPGKATIDTKGCAGFRANLTPEKLKLFKKDRSSLSHPGGSTVYINEQEQLIMFEKYEM